MLSMDMDLAGLQYSWLEWKAFDAKFAWALNSSWRHDNKF